MKIAGETGPSDTPASGQAGAPGSDSSPQVVDEGSVTAAAGLGVGAPAASPVKRSVTPDPRVKK